MKELCVLLAPAFWSIRNDIVRLDLAFYRRVLFYTAISIVFIVLITKLLNAGMTQLQGLSAEVFYALLIKGYSLIFIIIFFTQILSGFTVSLNTYYRSRDLEVLLTSPVNRTSLFLSRLFETHIATSWMLAIFGIPLLVSSGLLYRANFFYYPLSLMLFIVFSTIPVNIGICTAIVFSSFFHVKKLQKTLLSAGIVAVVLLITLLRLFRPERFVNPELFANLTFFINEIKTPSFILLPNRWLSESVFGLMGRAAGGNTVIFVSLLFLTSYISAFFLQMVFKRYHYRGWGLLQEGSILREARTHTIRSAHGRQGGLLIGIVKRLSPVLDVRSRMLIRKDLLYQTRDTGNIHQILILLSLIVIYLFSIASLPLNWVGYTVQLRYTSSFFNLGLILVIIAGLCSRIVYPAVASEGLSLWIIKTSPVTPKQYIWTKFFFFLALVLIVGQFLAVSSSLLIGVEKPFLILECITVTMLSFSLVGMTIFFGVSGFRSTVTGSAEEVGPSSALHMIAAVLLILLTLVLQIVPAFLYFLRESTQTIFTKKALIAIGAEMLFLFVVNVFVTSLSIRFSIKAFERFQASEQ